MGRRKMTQCRSQRVFQKLNQERLWTTKEKEMLLLGLRLYGTSNYEQLQQFVPRRSMIELRNFLQMHKLEGMWKPKNPEAEAPIDLWLEALGAKDRGGCLNAGNSKEISQQLKLIAVCERHPPPEKCEGVDFKELYYYLATVLSGTHPRHISLESAQLIFHCCLWLASMTVDQDLSTPKNFLNKVNASRDGVQIKNTYSKHALMVPPEDSINADKAMNPLGVPCEMLMLSAHDAALISGENLIGDPYAAPPAIPETISNSEIDFGDADEEVIKDQQLDEGQITVVFDDNLMVDNNTEFSIVVNPN
ncbi:Hypothetical predicted protein [Cloeon dipterum]|uniref:Myb-like domain-containing protein n=1 Tax=Cloeon dipterum TaxID=197152 RepID=A0A8S1C6J0_9INSE|nr:Hypothetical predicted protein [Cloeon dipterum]